MSRVPGRTKREVYRVLDEGTFLAGGDVEDLAPAGGSNRSARGRWRQLRRALLAILFGALAGLIGVGALRGSGGLEGARERPGAVAATTTTTPSVPPGPRPARPPRGQGAPAPSERLAPVPRRLARPRALRSRESHPVVPAPSVVPDCPSGAGGVAEAEFGFER